MSKSKKRNQKTTRERQQVENGSVESQAVATAEKEKPKGFVCPDHPETELRANGTVRNYNSVVRYYFCPKPGCAYRKVTYEN